MGTPKVSGRVREVIDGIFAIDVPMPNSPLKTMNAYLVRGPRSLLIDTGFNTPECIDVVREALTDLGVSLDYTDILITHCHTDHAGMVPNLLTGQNKLFMSYNDGKFLNEMVYIDYGLKIQHESILFGVPSQLVLRPQDDPSAYNAAATYVDFECVQGGDVLAVGDYRFEVVDLAGHTPGQIGLYDRAQRVMFCGDHLMNDITPNIVVWNDCVDSIQLFCDNLTKLKDLDVEYMFPAHRGRVLEWRTRVDQIIAHHDVRCQDIVHALGSGPRTVYETCLAIPWNFGTGNFEDFPALQAWFGTSEGFAHLEHLRRQGVVSRTKRDEVWTFSLPVQHCTGAPDNLIEPHHFRSTP